MAKIPPGRSLFRVSHPERQRPPRRVHRCGPRQRPAPQTRTEPRPEPTRRPANDTWDSRRLGNRPDALIEALHSAQEAFGYIDDDALRYISDSLAVPPSKVFGVATFYHHFTLEPRGEHTCVVCTGTACYVNGAMELLASIRAGLGVKPHETTADRRLSLLTGRCFGSCSLAPAAIVDGEVQGRVDARELVARLQAL